MNKSYTKDVQVLLKMIDNVNSARDVILRFNISFNYNDRNCLCKNKDAMDLCSFYMAQFGEKVKLLTDSTKADLSKVVDLGIMKYFRNIIDHDYESVNKQVLMVYIQQLTSDRFLNSLVNRLRYCKRYKR